jgi:hypothetical protein
VRIMPSVIGAARECAPLVYSRGQDLIFSCFVSRLFGLSSIVSRTTLLFIRAVMWPRWFMLDTGIRISELTDLDHGDVDWDNLTLRVHGKRKSTSRVWAWRIWEQFTAS